MEGLRAYLAWWVVIRHVLEVAGLSREALPRPACLLLLPGFAVDVFILLSGFFIFRSIDRSWSTLHGFLLRRFLRLYPVFILCLVATALLEQVAFAGMAAGHFPDPHLQGLISSWQPPGGTFWKHFLLHLTMLHGAVPDSLLPGASAAILPPAWSISLEWQFYLIAPALYFASRRHHRWLATVGLITVLSVAITPHLSGEAAAGRLVHYTLASFVPLRADYFFVGATSYFFWKMARTWDAGSSRLKLASAAILLAASFTGSRSLILWTSVLALHLLLQEPGSHQPLRLAGWALNGRLPQWLGRISYSTCLCHGPVIGVVLLLLHKVHPSWPPMTLFLVLTAVCVPLTLALSHVLFHLVETPFNALARRLTARTPHPARSPALATE